MNINNLTSIIYSNLSKKSKFEPENAEDNALQNINKFISKNVVDSGDILSSKEQLKLLLSTANLPTTKENINLIKSLIQNNLPANKENIQTMVKGTKIFKDFPLEKALFLIQNNLKPTLQTAKQIEGYISKDTSISKQMHNLFNSLSNLDNIENLEDIFKNTTSQQDVKNLVSILKDIKTEVLNTILKEETIQNNNIDKNIKNILNTVDEILNLTQQKPENNHTNKTQNKINEPALNKQNILKNIIDLAIDKNIILNQDKLKNITKIFDNINLNKNNTDTILKSLNQNNKTDDSINLNKDFILNNLDNINNLDKNINISKNEITHLKSDVFKHIFKNVTTIKQIEKDIFNIIKFIESHPDKNKNNINFKDFLLKSQNFQNKIKTFDFENNSQEDLNTFFKDISTICKNTKEHMLNFNKNNDEVLKNVEDINKNLDFMTNLKDSTFLQIPLNINNFSTTAELYVFSDKKNKNTNNKKNSGSALLSLNLAYLGKLEAYITKVDNNIGCQFRLKEEETKKLLKENVPLLESYLKEKKLILKEISFKDLDQNFNIITNNVNNNNIEDIQISNFNTKA